MSDRDAAPRRWAWLTVLLLAATCRPGDGPRSGDNREGSALHPAASHWTYRPGVALSPGDEFVMIFTTLTNVSDDVVSIREVNAVNVEGVPQVARIERIELMPISGSNVNIPLGRYLSYPPVHAVGSRCFVASLHPVEGYRLPPDTRRQVRIVMAIRAVGPGLATFGAQRVVYEQAGEVVRQDFPFTIRLSVKELGRGLAGERGERRCARREGVSLLRAR